MCGLVCGLHPDICWPISGELLELDDGDDVALPGSLVSLSDFQLGWRLRGGEGLHGLVSGVGSSYAEST